MFENDDYLSGEVDESEKVRIAVKPGQVINNNDYVVSELIRIVELTKKHNLQEKPEVLSGLLDDLSKTIKGGNVVAILKSPVVYVGIAAILSGIILYKVSKGKK